MAAIVQTNTVSRADADGRDSGSSGSRRRLSETATHAALAIVALSSLFFMMGIILVLFQQAMPAVMALGPTELVYGKEWYPADDPPAFGALPLLSASAVVTVGATAVAVPLGLLSALCISQILPTRVRSIVKPAVELLAGLPSVVYGLFGMGLVAPLTMRMFRLPTGLTAFTASIVLGIMALPTVASVAEDAFSAVPRTCKEASLALGATTWETISRVLLPAAAPGVVAAVLLGIGRAMGETMAVLMVAGGAAVIPLSPFQPVRPITATIAAEMGETPVGSLHYHALFALAAMLFIITAAFNLVAEALARRLRRQTGGDAG